MWLYQRYHRSSCSRAATITARALVVGLMAVLPGCGSPPRPGPTGQPPVAALTQAPALPGAQPISANDRVYTADQDSNTVTVIDPKTTTVLGTIPLGKPRMDTNADVLGAMYDGQIGVHGLGFARDGQYLDVIDVTTNAVHVIDVASHKILQRVEVPSDAGGSSDEAISPDGKEIWLGMPNNGKTTPSSTPRPTA
jgi:YVTN family beta-propeller protein